MDQNQPPVKSDPPPSTPPTNALHTTTVPPPNYANPPQAVPPQNTGSSQLGGTVTPTPTSQNHATYPGASANQQYASGSPNQFGQQPYGPGTVGTPQQDKQYGSVDYGYPQNPQAAYGAGTPQQSYPAPMQQDPSGQYLKFDGQPQYLYPTPIQALNRSPAPVDCPVCGHRALTSVSYHTGNTTHLWAALLCVCLCLGCIPYLVNGLKDVDHRCGNCGTHLAVWHRSGSIDVLVHPRS